MTELKRQFLVPFQSTINRGDSIILLNDKLADKMNERAQENVSKTVFNSRRHTDHINLHQRADSDIKMIGRP